LEIGDSDEIRKGVRRLWEMAWEVCFWRDGWRRCEGGKRGIDRFITVHFAVVLKQQSDREQRWCLPGATSDSGYPGGWYE